MASSLPTYPPFDCKADGKAVRWNKWTVRLDNLFTAYEITDNTRKKALLLTYGGDDLNDLVDTIPEENLTPASGENVYDKLVKAVKDVFNPSTNTEFQKYCFRNAKQKSDSINEFYTELKQLAETCNFGAIKEQEIKSQLIAGCKNSKVRQKGLSDSKITLTKLLEFARTLELTEANAKTIEGQTAHAIAPKHQQRRKNHRPQQPQQQGQGKRWNTPKSQYRPSGASQTCRHCGEAWPHKGGQTKCPAFGKVCSKCGKHNHFARICMSSNKAQTTASISRDDADTESGNNVASISHHSTSATPGDDYVFATKPVHPSLPSFKINLGQAEIVALADSGSTVNIISSETLDSLPVKYNLTRSGTNVFPYSSEKALEILGTFHTNVLHAGKTVNAKFLAIPGNACPIIGWETSQELGLLSSSNSDTVHSFQSSNTMLDQYPELFNGVGKLKDFKVKLHIDESVTPVAQTTRRVPFHIRKDVEKQLEHDTELGIVEKTSGPTPWVSPIVCVPKPKTGKIRVCVDMRQANKAIKRERHSMPTIDELITELSGASVFSKLDLNQGYNQLELDESSRYITTFATHLGLRRYTRLFFGINSAAEVFQEAIHNALQGVSGSINISDDILVFGKNQREHDANLRNTLKRLSEKGLTLNRTKCELNVESVEYFGHIFSSKGVSASKAKVDSIRNMPSPTNVGELRSLLGMMNYCGSRFVPDYSGLTHELRQLTKKDVEWSWNSKHENAVKTLKEALARNITLNYFDAGRKTELYCDASPVGLCAILTQIDVQGERNVVQFASRPLSSVESRYSQTEREALGVVFGCEHFHMFLYGSPFVVVTDHKPLIYMYGPTATTQKLTPRLERWALRLQPYDITVVYKPGSQNPADYFSRHPSNDFAQSTRASKVAEEYVQYIIDSSTPKTMTLREVAEATQADPVLRAVMEAVRTNRWYEARCAEGLPLSPLYKTLQNNSAELSLGNNDTILLKGDRIVLPSSLQCRAVEIAHAGHQGITKTVALLREKVWFQGMHKAVEDKVKHCLHCQVNTPTTSREPLQMSTLPDAPWTDLSADFGQVAQDTYILVIQDEYSRYVVVEVLTSLTAKSVIPRFDKVFSEFGIPKTLKTDNGPPFNSDDFKKYMNLMGVHHRRITPLWPRANGETERFMRTVKKVIREKPHNWKQQMHKLLLDYRSTPHSTTGVAPATVLFGRTIGTRLPAIMKIGTYDSELRQKDYDAKMIMKGYADNKRYVKESTINIGDVVHVKNTGVMKGTPYDSRPLIVVDKKGSMITAQRGEQQVTRNSSFFKPSPSPPVKQETLNEDTEAHDRPMDTPMDTQTDTPMDTQTDTPVDTPVSTSAAANRPKRVTKVPSHFKDFIM